MKLSLYYGVSDNIRNHGWEATAKNARELGCTLIETLDNLVVAEPPVLKSIDDARRARKILDAHGISVSCCSVFANLYNSPETVSFLKSYSELVAEIGSPFLHHTLLPWIEPCDEIPEFEEGIERAVDAAEEIAKHAAKFGVTCLYEDQGLIANGIVGYRRFFEEIRRRCSNVGVCGDIGNSLFADVAPKEFLKEFISDIKHVHVKDFRRFPTNPENDSLWMRTRDGSYIADVPLGTGHCEIDECIKILKSSGYDDVISIEATDSLQALEYMKKRI